MNLSLDPKLTKSWLDFEQFQAEFEKRAVVEKANRVREAIPKPVLSVVLVTYQHVNYIETAIESILNQVTSEPFELIIGDDQSDDGTREICEGYADENPERIRLFFHNRENNIRVLGRPTGIFQIAYNLFQCRGKYVVLTSGDDYWTCSDKLQKQIDFLDANADVSYVYHKHDRVFTETGEVKGPYYAKRIQTVMGRNVFKRLPREFLEVMQEDSFLKFFWEQVGRSAFMPNVAPAVVRFHSESMYTSLESSAVYELRKHLWRKIIAASQSVRRVELKAKVELAKVIFYKRRLKNKVFGREGMIAVAAEWREENVMSAGVAFLFLASFKKLFLRG